MAAVAIDENVIKLTSETLGKVIKQVPLTDKLLSRPPFKFIHDIIKEVSALTASVPISGLELVIGTNLWPTTRSNKSVSWEFELESSRSEQIIRNNGFLAGLYTDDELSSENIKNKEAKIEFLQKTIDALGFITNAPLGHIRANKIVAGLEPEHTNELLQTLGKCVISRKSHEVAVKKVLNGEKPGASSSVLSAEEAAQNESPKKKKPSTGSEKRPAQTQATSNKPASTSKSTPKSPSVGQGKPPKTPIKSTSTSKKSAPPASKPSATKPSANSKAANSSTIRSNQPTKVSNGRATVQKSPATATSPAVKRGQEKIAKPVTKPAANKPASKANLVNQGTNGRTTTDRSSEPKRALVKSRTLTKEELSAVQASKQANRAEAENEAANLSETNLEANAATNLNGDDVAGDEEEAAGERNGKNVDTINEPVSSGMANPVSESIAESDLRTQNQRSELEESGERAQGSAGKGKN